jgi:hypothetical protein
VSLCLSLLFDLPYPKNCWKILVFVVAVFLVVVVAAVVAVVVVLVVARKTILSQNLV